MLWNKLNLINFIHMMKLLIIFWLGFCWALSRWYLLGFSLSIIHIWALKLLCIKSYCIEMHCQINFPFSNYLVGLIIQIISGFICLVYDWEIGFKLGEFCNLNKPKALCGYVLYTYICLCLYSTNNVIAYV